MNLRQIEKKIELFDFPVLPQILVQMKQIADSERASVKDLAEVILKDQALTLKILSVANSAYYGFYGKVSTITHAIVALGFDPIKNIALGLAIFKSLSALIKEPCIRQFWEHSLATGVCAELLAEKLGYSPSEEALVAGLIHDVGKLLLINFFPEEYGEVQKIIEEHDAYPHVVEASILGVTHVQVGELMAKKWGLPASLISVIANHHKKEWGVSALTDIVAFSDFMIYALPSGRESGKIDQLINLGSSVLSLKKESITGVTKILAERLEEYSRIFEVRIDNLMAYTTMVEEEYVKLKKSASATSLSRKEEEMSILSEISNAMIKGRPQDEILQMVLEGIIRIEGATVVIIFVLHHEKPVIKVRFGLGKNVMEFCSTFFLSPKEDTSLIVQAVHFGERRFFKKQGSDSSLSFPEQAMFEEFRISSACIIPLLMKGKTFGALVVGWEAAPENLDVQELQTLSLFANQASLVLKGRGTGGQEREVAGRRRSSLLLDID